MATIDTPPQIEDCTLEIVRVQNVWDRSQRTSERAAYTGAPLLSYIEDVEGRNVVVSVRGKIIPKQDWGLTIPGPCDQIIVIPVLHDHGSQAGGGGGGGKSILRLILGIAVAVLAIVIPFAAGLTGVAFGLVSAAISIGGGLLVNALIPQPSAQIQSAQIQQETPQTYSWQGPQMLAQQGVPIPKGYGKFRSGGNVVSSYTHSAGDKDYLNLLISYGHGPGKAIYGIKINGNPIENYKGVTVEKRLGYMDQQPISYFNNVINEYPQSQQITIAGGPVVVNGTRTDTQAFEVEVTFPRGLWQGPDQHGQYNPWRVTWKVEYSLVGSGVWTEALSPRTTADVPGVPEWIAISGDQAFGGPKPIVVVATATGAAAHTLGEVLEFDTNVDTFDAFGTHLGNRPIHHRAHWIPNPLGPLATTGVNGQQPSQLGGTPQTVTNWANVVGSTVGRGTKVIRDYVRVDNLAPGQYNFRITKVGSTGGNVLSNVDNNSANVGEDIYLTSIREIVYDDQSLPGQILLGIRALATDQLSGGGLNVTAIVDYGVPITAGYKNLVAADRPQVYFRFNEAATAATICVDSSGRGNDGTYSATGITGLQNSLITKSNNSAILLDGNMATTYIDGFPTLTIGTDWSFETWIAPATGGGALFTGTGVSLWLDPSMKLRLDYSAVGHLSAGVVPNAATHIAVSVRAGVASFYINGVKDANTYGAVPTATITRVLQGFFGLADELAIYVPSIHPSNFTNRITWGKSRTNVLEDMTGDNQAVVALDVLTNPYYGGGIPFSAIDDQQLLNLANFCNEIVPDGYGGFINRHLFNAIFDQPSNVWDSLAKIGVSCRSVFIRQGTKYSVIIDKPEAPSQLFSVGNIIQDSFKESWLGLTDRANSIDLTFNDINSDYVRQPMTVERDADIAAGSPIVKAATLDFFGAVYPGQVWRQGQYALLNNFYSKKMVEFEAAIDAVACTVGSVIEVQHDIPKWGSGGRIQDGSTATLAVLDQKVTLDPLKLYSLMVNLPSVARASGTIASVVNDIVTLNGYTGQSVKRLVVGAIDAKIIAYGPGYVQVYDPTGIPGSGPYTVYDTDVVQTVPIVPGTGGAMSTVPLASSFDVVPAFPNVYAFGETTLQSRQFRVTKISRSGDLTFRISGVEYNPGLYTDLDPVLPSSLAAYPTYGPTYPNLVAVTPAIVHVVNPDNVKLFDGILATFPQASQNATEPSDVLLIKQFKFKVAPKDVINGIKVEMKRSAIFAAGGHVADGNVQILKNGVVVGTDHAAFFSNWGVNDGWVSYGGQVDLWGSTWTPADINGDGFGVRITFNIFTPSGAIVQTTAQIDAVRISVYTAKAIDTAVTNLILREDVEKSDTGVWLPFVNVTWTPGKKTQGVLLFISYTAANGTTAEKLLADVPRGSNYRFSSTAGQTIKVRAVGYDSKNQLAPSQSAPTQTLTLVSYSDHPQPQDAIIHVGTFSVVNNSYSFRRISSLDYTVAAGDILLFDQFIDPLSPSAHAGLDFVFTPADVNGNVWFRGFSLPGALPCPDQFGYGPSPNVDLAPLCFGRWVTRAFRIGDVIPGKTITSWASCIGASTPSLPTGAYKARLANIRIINGSTQQALIYGSGQVPASPPWSEGSALDLNATHVLVTTSENVADRDHGKNVVANPGFESNTTSNLVNVGLPANQAGNIADGWAVETEANGYTAGSPYHSLWLESSAVTPHSGKRCLLIRLNTGITIPGVSGWVRGAAKSLLKIPLTAGDVFVFGGWLRCDRNAILPAGVQAAITIRLLLFDADDTYLGYAVCVAEDSTTAFAYKRKEGTYQVPSSPAVAYGVVHCASYINNTNVGAFSPGASLYVDARFDDIYFTYRTTQKELQVISIGNRNSAIVGGNPCTPSGVGGVAVAAFVVQYGFGQVGYSAGSIGSLANSTVYAIYCDDPSFAGGSPAGGYHATAAGSGSVLMQSEFRLYIGDVQTNSAAGTGGGSGGGGGGGGSDCPDMNTWLRDDLQVKDAKVGDMITVELEDDVMAMRPIDKISEPVLEDCIEIIAANGARKIVSYKTPCRLKGGQPTWAVNLRHPKGIFIMPTLIDGVQGYSRVRGLYVGKRLVRHIHVGDLNFAGGVEKGKLLFTHNMPSFPPVLK